LTWSKSIAGAPSALLKSLNVKVVVEAVLGALAVA
jgi:hypothetical protein